MFDVGSVKEPIVKAIELTHSTPTQFVPCHPISGSEKSGPQAADGDLLTVYGGVDAIGQYRTSGATNLR